MNENNLDSNNKVSSWWLILQLTLVLLWVSFFKNGYFVLRGDHVSIMGYFLNVSHPELLKGDWFFCHESSPFARMFEIATMWLLAKPFGMVNGILVFFILTFISLVWAWIALGKRLSGSLLPGVLAMMMCIMASNMEIGVQTLFDTMKESRVTAAAFASWGFVMVLSHRYILAGVLMGLGIFAHSSTGPLFIGPFLLWHFFVQDKFDWKNIGKLLLGIVPILIINVLLLFPMFFMTSGGTPLVSEKEQFDLLSKVHIPYLMSPMSWGFRWRYFAGLMLIFTLTWGKTYKRIPWAWVFGKMVIIVCALLAVCTVWIELRSSMFLLKLQPYRMSMLLYPTIFMILSVHIIDLWSRGNLLARLRAVVLVLGLLWRNYLSIGVIETSWEVLTLCAHHRHWVRGHLLNWLLPASRFHSPSELTLSRTQVRGLVVLNVVFTLLIVGMIAFKPFTRAMQSVSMEPTQSERLIGTLAWKFQFEGCPVSPIERLAAWAKDNTPPTRSSCIHLIRMSNGFAFPTVAVCLFRVLGRGAPKLLILGVLVIWRYVALMTAQARLLRH